MPSFSNLLDEIKNAPPAVELIKAVEDIEEKSLNPRRRALRKDDDRFQYRVKSWLERPAIDPAVMFTTASSIWIVRAAIDKRVNVANTKPDFVPKFAAKCLECDLELDAKPDNEECPQCGNSVLQEPDDGQLKRVWKLINTPNIDDEGKIVYPFRRLIRDWLWYVDAIDDVFIEITYAWDGNPAEWWPLPSEFIKYIDDLPATKTGGRFFCRVCWDPENDVTFEEEGDCPSCEEALFEVEYVQVNEIGEIENRFARENIIHYNAMGIGGRRWGVPKLMAVYYITQVIRWQELKQWQFYANDFSPDKILTLPGMSPEVVQDMMYDTLELKRRNPGRLVTVMLAAQDPPVVADLSYKFTDFQSIEWQMAMREAVGVVYEVGLNMLGIQTPGKLGSETEVVEVSYASIERFQDSFNDFMNHVFLPLFQVHEIGTGNNMPMVTDWEFKLEPAKKEDKFRKAQVSAANLQVAAQLEEMGFEIELDETNEMYPTVLRRKPEEERQQQQPGGEFGGGFGGGGGSPFGGETRPFSRPFGSPMSGPMEFSEKSFAYPEQEAELSELMDMVRDVKEALRKRKKGRDLAAEAEWAAELFSVDLILDRLVKALDDIRVGPARIGTSDSGIGVLGYELYGRASKLAGNAAKALSNMRVKDLSNKMAKISRMINDMTRLVIDKGTIEKGLSPRSTPPGSAVPRLRLLEDTYLEELQKSLSEAVDKIGRDPDNRENILRELSAAFEGHTNDFVRDIYEAGMAEETPPGIAVSFDQVDEGAIEYLKDLPNGIVPTLKKFTDAQRDRIETAVRSAFTEGEPMDLPLVVDRLKDAVAGSDNDLKRIARTETSRVVNLSRAAQWRKYTDPNVAQFEWIIAKHPSGDERVCPICFAIANGGTVEVAKGVQRTYPGNPYALPELEALVPHLLVHPSERCTVARNPALAKESK